MAGTWKAFRRFVENEEAVDKLFAYAISGTIVWSAWRFDRKLDRKYEDRQKRWEDSQREFEKSMKRWEDMLDMVEEKNIRHENTKKIASELMKLDNDMNILDKVRVGNKILEDGLIMKRFLGASSEEKNQLVKALRDSTAPAPKIKCRNGNSIFPVKPYRRPEN